MDTCCYVHPATAGSCPATTQHGGDVVTAAATAAAAVAMAAIANGVEQQQQQQLKLPVYSREQVTWHASSDSCWVIIDDRVYDVTDFLKQHPGGADVILENAGADCTAAFKDTGHSEAARRQLAKYLIGRLPERLRSKSDCFRGY